MMPRSGAFPYLSDDALLKQWVKAIDKDSRSCGLDTAAHDRSVDLRDELYRRNIELHAVTLKRSNSHG